MDTKLRTISTNARIHYDDIAHQEGSGLYVINPTVGYSVRVHSTCMCNELVALHNRHLIDRSYIAYDDAYFKTNFRRVSKGWKYPLVMRNTYLDVAMSYAGRKRKIYLSARKQLLMEGMTQRDYIIKMFVKQDRYEESLIRDKMPRAIQARTPKFNLKLATYLQPFEHLFYVEPGLGPSGTRVVSKGMNPHEIALLFVKKAGYFDDPVYISCDHSKFDSTVRVEHLRAEHRIYLKSYPSKVLAGLLRAQINNKGFSRHGIKYSIRGTRMSGDYNTGLGNSLLNRAVLESWVINIKHEIILDGDDSIVIVEANDLNKLDRSHFTKMGFETTLEIHREITNVDYCQARLVLCDPPVMCRNPCRALSNAAVCLRKYPIHLYREWMSSVFDCLVKTHVGIPLYHVLKHHVRKFRLVDEDYNRKMEGFDNSVVRVMDREAFAKTWNLTPHNQLLIENELSVYFGYKLTPKLKLNHYLFKHKYLSCGLDKNVADTLNKQSLIASTIGSRFHTLPTSSYEFWYKFGQNPPEPGFNFPWKPGASDASSNAD